MITEIMTKDHRDCDLFFEKIDQLIQKKDFDKIVKTLSTWKMKNFNHFEIEENLLFKELEAKIGSKIPPVQMMEHEHIQIRNLICETIDNFNLDDIKTFLGNIDTCFMMIQQHNIKEEQILYPLIDRELNSSSSIKEKLLNLTK